MNQVEATDQIVADFKRTWDPGIVGIYPYAPQVLFEGIDRDDQPDDHQDAFVRFRIRHNVASQRSMGSVGGRKWQDFGLVLVQLLAPWQNGAGYTCCQRMADVAVQAFRAPGGGKVLYSVVHPTEIGRDGLFYQINVTANWSYLSRA